MFAISKWGISTVFIGSVLLSCLCGCGSNSNPAGPSGSPTAVVTPTPQIIWQNGTVGCWGGNCTTGGLTIGDVVTPYLTTGSNTLEFYFNNSSQNPANLEPSFKTQNVQVKTAYTNGHLQFDIELGQSASLYSSINVAIGSGWTTLNLSALSASSFTHISIPFTSMGGVSSATYLALFLVDMTTNTGASTPYVYFNNVEWTPN